MTRARAFLRRPLRVVHWRPVAHGRRSARRAVRRSAGGSGWPMASSAAGRGRAHRRLAAPRPSLQRAAGARVPERPSAWMASRRVCGFPSASIRASDRRLAEVDEQRLDALSGERRSQERGDPAGLLAEPADQVVAVTDGQRRGASHEGHRCPPPEQARLQQRAAGLAGTRPPRAEGRGLPRRAAQRPVGVRRRPPSASASISRASGSRLPSSPRVAMAAASRARSRARATRGRAEVDARPGPSRASTRGRAISPSRTVGEGALVVLLCRVEVASQEREIALASRRAAVRGRARPPARGAPARGRAPRRPPPPRPARCLRRRAQPTPHDW